MLLAQGLCGEGAMDWFYNLYNLPGLPSSPLTWRSLPRWGCCWTVCGPCSWRWYCCEPYHQLNYSLNLHSFLQCHLNLFHEDSLDFLSLDEAQSKQKSEHVSSESVCALDGRLTWSILLFLYVRFGTCLWQHFFKHIPIFLLNGQSTLSD